MFRVNSVQLTSFCSVELQGLTDRIVYFVHSCVPGASPRIESVGFRAQVRSWIDEAVGHGIIAEREVCLYVVLRLTYGEICRYPIVKEILLRDDPATTRIEAIFNEFVQLLSDA
jgi:hypothetical protein